MAAFKSLTLEKSRIEDFSNTFENFRHYREELDDHIITLAHYNRRIIALQHVMYGQDTLLKQLIFDLIFDLNSYQST